MPGYREPLLPRSAIQPLQESLDRRSLEQSPLEAQIKGFGAGALEGLRNLTSPKSLIDLGITFAVPEYGALRAAKAVPQAIRGLKGVAGLAAPKTTKAVKTLGEQFPEFTAVGEEALYNTGKAIPSTIYEKFPGLADMMASKYLSRIK